MPLSAKCARARLTYKNLALKLELSEGAIKRMFALNRMTLDRVDQICDILKVDMAELVDNYVQDEQRLDQLTEAQERLLVQDPKRLLVAACVLNRWSFEEILDIYAVNHTECIRHLAALDKIQFIELLPANRYRIKVSDSFRWRSGVSSNCAAYCSIWAKKRRVSPTQIVGAPD